MQGRTTTMTCKLCGGDIEERGGGDMFTTPFFRCLTCGAKDSHEDVYDFVSDDDSEVEEQDDEDFADEEEDDADTN